MARVLLPLIPAEAGTQCFGFTRIARSVSHDISAVRQMAQTWVPASAGMSGGF